MKHVFILNPQAGKSTAEKEILPELIEAAKQSGLDYSIHRTGNVGEATSFVHRILRENPDKQYRFYAIGGDGTINEVASGMIGFTHCELAVIPCGSGNDFVKMFGKTKDFFNFKAQFNGTVRQVDLIQINDRICVNMINIGIDSATASTQQTLKATTPLEGSMSYIVALMKNFAGNKPSEMTITLDDGSVYDGEFELFSVGNGAFCGGGFKSAPEARVDDGLLEVSIIKKVSRIRFLSLVGSYHEGTHIRKESAKDIITYVKASSVHISLRSDTPICIDGEIIHEKEIDVKVLPLAVNFVVPEGCSAM